MFKFKDEEKPLINLYQADYSPEDWEEILEGLQIDEEADSIENVSIIVRAIKQIKYK